MYVVFKNKGVIDPRSITTFGVSSKESANAIGFFGTGLKYAISILLRHGCDISIFSGKEEMTFGVERTKIRLDEFDVVTMNGRPLDFTTDVGKTWELWQAFRELYCNCVDENGEAFDSYMAPEPEEDTTTVVVSGTPFLDVWALRSEIILGSQPIERHGTVNIHPGPSEHVYYRGVRAYKLDKPSRFTYNIMRHMDLTEDRTLKYGWDVSAAVRRGLCQTNTAQIVKTAVTAPKDNWEAHMEYEGVEPSSTFVKEVSALARSFDPGLNQSALRAVRCWAMEQLHEDTEGIKLDAIEQERMKRAVSFCRRIGYPVDEFPIIVSEYLGPDVLGQSYEGKIYISKRTLMMGTKMLAGTLIEEFLHLRHHLYDESRQMQNFLLDALVTMGETILGEPL